MVLLHFCDVCSVESKTMPHVGVQVKQNKLVFQSLTKHMFREKNTSVLINVIDFKVFLSCVHHKMIRTLFLVKKQRRRLNWNVQMNNWVFTYCLLPQTLGHNTFGSLLDIKRCCNSKAQRIERQESKNLRSRVGKQSTWEAIACAILFMFCNIKPLLLPHAWTGGYGGSWGYSSKPAREHIFAKKRMRVQNDLGSRNTSQPEQTNKRGWSRKKEQGG